MDEDSKEEEDEGEGSLLLTHGSVIVPSRSLTPVCYRRPRKER